MVQTFTNGILSNGMVYSMGLPFAVMGGAIGWVLLASRFGLPVSTTHVSSCAIVGVGLRQARTCVNWKVVGEILLAWVVTLPVSGLLAAGFYLIFASW
jgi:PiT family inorganic phosphate transporter